jgi:methyl-accepting chemotaxis protein
MAKFKKNMIISEQNYSGSGLWSKLSFSSKLNLALFILLAGLLIQFSTVVSHFYQYRNDLKDIALSRKANDDFIMALRNHTQDILAKIYVVKNSGITVDISPDLAQMQQTVQNFSNNLDNNVISKFIANFETVSEQFIKTGTLVNPKRYQVALDLFNQFGITLTDLEKALSGYYQNQYQEIMVISIIKLMILLLTLLAGIIISKYLVKCAIRSIDEPADRIIRVLQGSNGDLKVKIPVYSSEGLGASGLLLNAGIFKWHEFAIEFKNASNKLNYLIEELSASFNQVFLLEAQLQGAYQEIKSSLDEQRQMGEKVNQEVRTITTELSELQFIPRKISQLGEELNSLLTVNKDSLSGLLNRQSEDKKESQSIVNYLKDLSATSGRVDRIMRELEEIEAESEMLAFNSAISAARAGEEGQGFSVVAKEIANLVERSKMASKNLSILISQIQAKTEQIVSVAPEKELIEEEKFSLDQRINVICANLNETAVKCLKEIYLMGQEVQTIFDKNNETFERINITSELTYSETDELGKIKDIIGRYLDSLKHTEEINTKIYESVKKLQSATNLLIN